MAEPSWLKDARSGLHRSPIRWVRRIPIAESGALAYGIRASLELVFVLLDEPREVRAFFIGHTPSPVVDPSGQVPRTPRTVAPPVSRSIEGGG